MKKIKFILLTLVIFLINLYSFGFATYQANIKTDKDTIDINDYINVTISIETDGGGDIGISEIKGLENFDIIRQAQSQSNSSQTLIKNGKTESKFSILHNLNLTLQAKSKGTFKIGPATIKQGKNTITTNSVSIEVTGDKLFINGNHLSVSNTSKPNTQNNPIANSNPSKNNINNIEDSVTKKSFSNNGFLYLFIIVILLVIILSYFIFKNKSELSEKSEKIKKGNDSVEEYKANNEIDFEEKINEKIFYPSINDENFSQKIDNIFRKKIETIYKIKYVKNKTYDEIINSLKITMEEKDKLKYIVNLLNKLKYSNIISNKSNLLEIIKNI